MASVEQVRGASPSVLRTGLEQLVKFFSSQTDQLHIEYLLKDPSEPGDRRR